jgi:DNA-binding CsgD family transcriptional regulator
MQTVEGLFSEAERFRDLTNGARVLDLVEQRFGDFRATHFLVTGVPLPGRPVEPLILRANWSDIRGDRQPLGAVDPQDPLLRPIVPGFRAMRLGREATGIVENLAQSRLAAMIGAGDDFDLLLVPINDFRHYQAFVIAGGPRLAFDSRWLDVLQAYCRAAFARLFALGALRANRPGELSSRERGVLELSALGKTAGEIADTLAISQRTVHAHLQNASEKLRAKNKTHTVVQALRFAQITV